MTHGSLVHWFIYTGGCTSAQATKLDAVAKSMGMGEDAGLELFARAQACSVEKAIYRMSIARADQSIAWARGRLTAIRYRRQWEVS